MGMGQSSVQQLPHDDDVRLVPQSRPIAAVGVRYCRSAAPVVLEITHQSILKPSRFVVRDPTTGAVCFHKDRKLLSTRQTLVDERDKVPVLNAKKLAFSSDFSVRPGADDTAAELLQMYAKLGLDRTDLRVSFANLTTGERCLMGMQGNWHLHQDSFWLKRGGTNGVRKPVAKVWPCNGRLQGTEVCALEVAPNVDAALILAICMVLDERWRRYKSRNDV